MNDTLLDEFIAPVKLDDDEKRELDNPVPATVERAGGNGMNVEIWSEAELDIPVLDLDELDSLDGCGPAVG